ARVLEEQAGLPREKHARSGFRARRDDRLAVRRRLQDGPPEPDALVRERDDVERAVDLAGLGGERQKREALLEPLRRDEVLDRRLLVGEEVGQREHAAANRLEVLRRTDAAAHDHEVRRRALADEDLRGGDELLPALLPADEP